MLCLSLIFIKSDIRFSAGTSIAVSSTLFGLVLVGRAAFVFPLANLANCFMRRDNKIEFRQQVIIVKTDQISE